MRVAPLLVILTLAWTVMPPAGIDGSFHSNGLDNDHHRSQPVMTQQSEPPANGEPLLERIDAWKVVAAILGGAFIVSCVMYVRIRSRAPEPDA